MNITRCLNFWHLNIIAEQTKSCFFSVPEGFWYWTPSLEIILEASTPSTVTGKYLRRHHSKCLFGTRNSHAALLSQELHNDHLNWDTSLSSVKSLAIDCVARFPVTFLFAPQKIASENPQSGQKQLMMALLSLFREPQLSLQKTQRQTI
jgi:hypothetical protein